MEKVQYFLCLVHVLKRKSEHCEIRQEVPFISAHLLMCTVGPQYLEYSTPIVRSPSPSGKACRLHSQRDTWSGPH